MNLTDRNPFETTAPPATEDVARPQIQSIVTAFLLVVCIAVLVFAFMLAPFAWLLRDGLGPDSVNSTGLMAVRKMFWCFYWGPVTAVITLTTVLLAVGKRLVG